MYVCVCIYMYMCIYVYVCVCLNVRMCVCILCGRLSLIHVYFTEYDLISELTLYLSR